MRHGNVRGAGVVIINLLPWRDDLHVYQRKNMFKIILLTLLLNLFLVLCSYFILTRQINKLDMSNHILKTKIKKEEATQHKDRHIRQPTIPASIIDNAVSYSRVTRKLMANLGQINHENICFSEIVRHKHQLNFKGYANSAMDLAVYLKDWRKSSLFSEMIINKINQQLSGDIYFQITAHEISRTRHAYKRNSVSRDSVSKSELDDDHAISI